MSRIDELIERLCPDGVEYKTLGEVGTFTRGSGIQKKDFVEEGVGCIHYGQVYTSYGLFADKTLSFISPDFARGKRMAKQGDLVIATTSENEEDVCKAVAWLGNEKIAVSNDAYIFSHSLNPKYMAYFFQSSLFQSQKAPYITGTKVLRVSGDSMAKFRIPIPPMKIQEEIVQILDSFSELEAKLETELETELETRKTQYAYYRNRLLSHEALNRLAGQKVEVRCIGNVCDTLTGYPFSSHQFTSSGILVVRGMNVKRGQLDLSPSNNRYWKQKDGLDKYVLYKGDIIIAMDGSLVGKSLGIYPENTPALLGQRLTRIRCGKTINQQYVFHCLSNGLLEEMTEKKKTSGAVPHISLKDINSIYIPVPPLAVQQRVVSILDRFNALTTSLADSLPAEIEARRKQYEYYRDKLLTFKEKPGD